MRGVFVTGTGTGIGKTLVAAGLLRALIDSGVSALPVKPVQTGCPRIDGRLSAPDLEFSLKAADLSPGEDLMDLMCPFRYSRACSPHLAGRMTGVYPDVETITGKMDQLFEKCDFLIAEGAGGVMVPLNGSEKMLDLMVELNWPVVLVARGDLGTINHSLLSLSVLKNAGLQIAAVVVNHLTEETSIVTIDNPLAIAQFSESVRILEIPYVRNVEDSFSNPSFRECMSELNRIIMEQS